MPTPPRAGETRQDFVSRAIPALMGDGTAASTAQAVAIARNLWRAARRVASDYEAPLTALEPMITQGENQGHQVSFECPMCKDSHRIVVAVEGAPDLPRLSLGSVGNECGFRGSVEGGRVRWTEYMAPEVDRG